MSNLLDIAEQLSHKLNKQAQAAEKKQDKLIFALEHLDAAAQMLTEDGNHLMSEAVTELMEKAVKVADDPDINRGDTSQEKYLVDLLQDATNDLVTLLESGFNDSEGRPISYEQKQYLLKQHNIPELQKDLYKLDLEIGQATHPSDTSGMLSLLLQLALYVHKKYRSEWVGRMQYELNPADIQNRMPESIKKLQKIKDSIDDTLQALENHGQRKVTVEEALAYLEDAPDWKNEITQNLESMIQEEGTSDSEISTERFKEHEHLPTNYRNRMEDALEREHETSMPHDIAKRDRYDVDRKKERARLESQYGPEAWRYEKEEELGFEEDDFSADDAQRLKDLW